MQIQQRLGYICNYFMQLASFTRQSSLLEQKEHPEASAKPGRFLSASRRKVEAALHGASSCHSLTLPPQFCYDPGCPSLSWASTCAFVLVATVWSSEPHGLCVKFMTVQWSRRQCFGHLAKWPRRFSLRHPAALRRCGGVLNLLAVLLLSFVELPGAAEPKGKAPIEQPRRLSKSQSLTITLQ